MNRNRAWVRTYKRSITLGFRDRIANPYEAAAVENKPSSYKGTIRGQRSAKRNMFCSKCGIVHGKDCFYCGLGSNKTVVCDTHHKEMH